MSDPLVEMPVRSDPARGAIPSPARDRGERLPVFKSLIPHAVCTASLDEIKDLELDVRIELGRARMRVEEVLKLSQGSVIELDRSATDPVEIYANDRLIARGEVVVLNEQFAVRVTEVISSEGRD